MSVHGNTRTHKRLVPPKIGGHHGSERQAASRNCLQLLASVLVMASGKWGPPVAASSSVCGGGGGRRGGERRAGTSHRSCQLCRQ